MGSRFGPWTESGVGHLKLIENFSLSGLRNQRTEPKVATAAKVRGEAKKREPWKNNFMFFG